MDSCKRQAGGVRKQTSICCRIFVVIFLLVNSSGDALNCSSSKSGSKENAVE